MIRLAVVGGGVMGANHARVASTLAGVDLVAVVEPDAERAARLAGNTGARPVGDVDELLRLRDRGELEVDAAVVAVPTSHHLDVASRLLRSGVDTLVEKPLAATVADAAAIVELATSLGRTLMVGHVERFNAVVAETIRLADTPVDIEATRVGPFTARIADSVVLDLMIHDLDIARTIARSELARVQAIARRTRTTTEDLAVALLEFDNGVTATLKASRLGQQKIRTLLVTLEDAVVTADLIRQDIAVSRVQHVEFLSESGSRYRQTGVVEVPFLDNRGEPLAAELASFRDAVETRATPGVTGEDGLQAVAMAHRVLAALTR